MRPLSLHSLQASSTAHPLLPRRYFALSRWERFLGFLLCIAGAAACFAVSFFIGLPMLAIKPRKFAVRPPRPLGRPSARIATDLAPLPAGRLLPRQRASPRLLLLDQIPL